MKKGGVDSGARCVFLKILEGGKKLDVIKQDTLFHVPYLLPKKLIQSIQILNRKNKFKVLQKMRGMFGEEITNGSWPPASRYDGIHYKEKPRVFFCIYVCFIQNNNTF